MKIKAMLKNLMEITPRSGFHDAVDRTLQGAYWLHSPINNLNHNTGYAMQVPLDDYFQQHPSENIPISKKRKVLTSAAGSTRATEQAEPDIDEAFSSLSGHNYPYDCYKVNIDNPHYDNKGTDSFHPP